MPEFPGWPMRGRVIRGIMMVERIALRLPTALAIGGGQQMREGKP
jgi:hypothetical protein